MCLPRLVGGVAPHISAVETWRPAGTHFLALLRPNLLRVDTPLHLARLGERDYAEGKKKNVL